MFVFNRHIPAVLLVVAAALLPGWSTARADIAVLAPLRDNTLYESSNGSLSNGAGQHFFAGHTSITTLVARRGLIAFDVAAHVPAGATIDSVTLTLHMSRAPFGAGAELFTLHRALAGWGEGTSDAPFQEGGGAVATAGDATWLHTFFDTGFWAVPGGDFSLVVSASRLVGDVGFYTWGPSAALRDAPPGTFGWIVIGEEEAIETTRRFDSRENPDAAMRPVLRIEYTAPAGAVGRVPDGATVPGIPLSVEPAPGGAIRLAWGGSCLAGDTDFAVYEGTLGSFYSHAAKICSTGGATSVTFTPAAGSRYYLVVARNAGREGSCGVDSSGASRPQGSPTCLPRDPGACP